MRGETDIAVHPCGPIDGTVQVPPSKSLTNRALALAALASGRSAIVHPLLAGDTLRMVRALRALGVGVEAGGPHREAIEEAIRGGMAGARLEGSLAVEGRGGSFTAPASPIDAGPAGTVMRFTTALASLVRGEVVIDGDSRMRQRPMGPLLGALRDLGVEARCLGREGFPPVSVRGGTLGGGTARIEGGVSSQFVSALLMIAPLAPRPVAIEVFPPLVSAPYIGLTLGLMERFGVSPGIGSSAIPGRGTGRFRPASPEGPLTFQFPGGGGYHPADYRVPPDASSASYFFAAAAVTGGRVTAPALFRDDPQADAALLGHLEAIGCAVEEDGHGTTVHGPVDGGLRSFDLDLGPTPDLVPTMAVLALFADRPSEVRNVHGLRLKESDRLRALANELTRIGAHVEEREDGLRVVPDRPRYRGARIRTYNDHRIAMAFAVAGLVVPGITIEDPGCVAKSFPGFFGELARLTMSSRC